MEIEYQQAAEDEDVVMEGFHDDSTLMLQLHRNYWMQHQKMHAATNFYCNDTVMHDSAEKYRDEQLKFANFLKVNCGQESMDTQIGCCELELEEDSNLFDEALLNEIEFG